MVVGLKHRQAASVRAPNRGLRGRLRESRQVRGILDQQQVLDYQSGMTLHKPFVIYGDNVPDPEKGGQLDYLSADLTSVPSTLNFRRFSAFVAG
jgi:hypothetical protein